jgi:hypothetical protein
MTGAKASSIRRADPEDRAIEGLRKMKKISCLVVLAAAMLPAISWGAECTYPKKPSKAPNGTRATRDEMVAAKKVQEQYQADVNAYLKCLKDEYDAALSIAKLEPAKFEDEKKKLTARWEKKNDAAVDEAQDVADRFNEQLSACKARPGGCK